MHTSSKVQQETAGKQKIKKRKRKKITSARDLPIWRSFAGAILEKLKMR